MVGQRTREPDRADPQASRRRSRTSGRWSGSSGSVASTMNALRTDLDAHVADDQQQRAVAERLGDGRGAEHAGEHRRRPARPAPARAPGRTSSSPTSCRSTPTTPRAAGTASRPRPQSSGARTSSAESCVTTSTNTRSKNSSVQLARHSSSSVEGRRRTSRSARTSVMGQVVGRFAVLVRSQTEPLSAGPAPAQVSVLPLPAQLKAIYVDKRPPIPGRQDHEGSRLQRAARRGGHGRRRCADRAPVRRDRPDHRDEHLRLRLAHVRGADQLRAGPHVRAREPRAGGRGRRGRRAPAGRRLGLPTFQHRLRQVRELQPRADELLHRGPADEEHGGCRVRLRGHGPVPGRPGRVPACPVGRLQRVAPPRGRRGEAGRLRHGRRHLPDRLARDGDGWRPAGRDRGDLRRRPGRADGRLLRDRSRAPAR